MSQEITGNLIVDGITLHKNDVGCYGFFGSSSDPAKGTGGGAVQIGHGFTSPTDYPQINLTDTIGGGSGASAHITVDSNGAITSVPVDNQGSGYYFADVDIQKPTNGAGARLYPVINGPITNILILNPGSGYSVEDTITISPPTQGTNYASAHVSSVDSHGKITGISITAQGDYYDSKLTGAEIDNSAGRGAQFQIVVNGKIRSIGIVPDYGGAGYTTSDTVTITNNPQNTLYLQQSVLNVPPVSPANLDLGNLTIHGDLHVDGEIDAVASGLFVNGVLTLADDNSIKPNTDNHSSIGESTKMWQNMYTRNIVLGNNSATPTPQYLTFSIDNTGLILTLTSSSSTGSLLPASGKQLDLGSSSQKWNAIYCTNLTANSISSATTLTINNGLTVSGNANISGYAQFNNNAKLTWVNTTTLAVTDVNGVTDNAGLDVGSIFINSLQPLNSGSPAGININCPLNIGGSRGTSGQVLTSNGSGSSPTWQTSGGWNGGTVSTPIIIDYNGASINLDIKNTSDASSILRISNRWTTNGDKAWIYLGDNNANYIACTYGGTLDFQSYNGFTWGTQNGSNRMVLDASGNCTLTGALSLQGYAQFQENMVSREALNNFQMRSNWNRSTNTQASASYPSWSIAVGADDSFIFYRMPAAGGWSQLGQINASGSFGVAGTITAGSYIVTQQTADNSLHHYLFGQSGKGFWAEYLWGTTSGGNAGNDYLLLRYGDDASFLGQGLKIVRSNGAIYTANSCLDNGVGAMELAGYIKIGGDNYIGWSNGSGGWDVYMRRAAANVLAIDNGSGGLGALNCSIMKCDYWQPTATGYLYFMNHMKSYSTGLGIYPYGDNNGSLGGNGAGVSGYPYWGSVYANYLLYKTSHGSFDAYDDLDLIRKMKTKTDADGKEIIDPDTIKHLLDGDGFCEVGKVNGWHLSVQRKMVEKFDENDAVNAELQKRIERLSAEVEQLKTKVTAA